MLWNINVSFWILICRKVLFTFLLVSEGSVIGPFTGLSSPTSSHLIFPACRRRRPPGSTSQHPTHGHRSRCKTNAIVCFSSTSKGRENLGRSLQAGQDQPPVEPLVHHLLTTSITFYNDTVHYAIEVVRLWSTSSAALTNITEKIWQTVKRRPKWRGSAALRPWLLE